MQQLEREKQFEFFRSTCRANRLRITPQRTTIYEELLKSDGHPTAEQVHSRVKRRLPNVSFDTVHRTLSTFAEHGLVDVVEGFRGPRRYDPDTERHHHAHCMSCGAIMDFYDSGYDRLKVPASVKHKFEIVNKKVILTGLCSKCRPGKR